MLPQLQKDADGGLTLIVQNQSPGKDKEANWLPRTQGLTLLSALHTTAAVARSITCTYPKDQELTFDVPKKLGGLPPIEFDYSSKVTRFSFRDDNLLLVAMDEVEKTRVRVVISAQLDKAELRVPIYRA